MHSEESCTDILNPPETCSYCKFQPIIIRIILQADTYSLSCKNSIVNGQTRCQEVHRVPNKRVYGGFKDNFSYFSTKTYVVTPH